MQRTTRARVRVAPCIALPCGDVLRLWKLPLRAAAETVESLCFENVVRWRQLAPRVLRPRQLLSLSMPVTHRPGPSGSYSLTLSGASRLLRGNLVQRLAAYVLEVRIDDTWCHRPFFPGS